MHDDLLVVARRVQSRLVDEVREVCAGEARRAARDDLDVDVLAERNLARVNLENALAAAHVGARDDDATVEAAGAQQRRVEHVGPVGRGHQDDAVVRLEAVHLDEQLVQGLLALVVTAAEARAAVTADGVDLVDEDDARRVLLALLEEVADARRADADEHLDEVGTRDREERDVGLARDGARQQRLAGARRAHHQDALRDAAAELLELLRLLEELDDLLQLFLGLVHAGDVLEGDALLLVVQELRARLAEAERLVAARLHLAQHEDPEADEEQDGAPPHQNRPEGAAGGGLDLGLLDVHLPVGVLLDGERHQVALDLVTLDRRLELSLVLVDGDDLGLFNRHIDDLPGTHLLDQLAVGQGLRVLALLVDDERVEHHRAGQDEHPENKLSSSGTQILLRLRRR